MNETYMEQFVKRSSHNLSKQKGESVNQSVRGGSRKALTEIYLSDEFVLKIF